MKTTSRQRFVFSLLLGILFFGGFYYFLCFRYSSLSMKDKVYLAPLYENVPAPTDFSTATFYRSANEITTQTTPIEAIKSVGEEKDFTLLLELLQRERQFTLRQACRRVSNQTCQSNNKLINEGSLYSKNYKLSVCDIFKCGYSAWLRAVFVMEDVYTVDEYLAGKIVGDEAVNLALKNIRILSTKNASQMEINWNESFRVILVRNPFERIVSAYNDKMVPTSDGYSLHYGPLSRRINEQYRRLRHKEEDRNMTDNGSATFEDFVNFLLLGNSTDGHWQFYYDKCDPCMSNYDYIAKFETLALDMDYLKKYLNISKEHQRAMFPKKTYHTSSSNMRLHFDQIPKSLARRLYEMYKKDFDLFGYELPEWLC